MARQRTPASMDASLDVDAALSGMNAKELRGLIRDLLLEFDDRAHGRILDLVIERAARSDSGWAPDRPTPDSVSSILDFAKAAKRVGYADPSEVDEYLRRGMNAFLGRDYVSAIDVFCALLAPLAEGDIDLGQHEMIDEVFSVDVAACAATYVVATYMSAQPMQRAETVWAAIDEVRGVGHFWEPLREMERVAVEPLARFDDFLRRWRVLIEENRGQRKSEWDSDEDRWLREVVERMEGADGLADLARATRRAGDLRAWCRMLVTAKDWKAALAAHEEAADIISDKAYSRGEFLDGVAFAARKLGRRDLPARLERAWREAPGMLRSRLPEHLSEMALFGLHTGCRQGEIVGLRWEWIVERDGIQYVVLPGHVTKNGESRPVVLNRVATGTVDARRGRHSTHVFTYQPRGDRACPPRRAVA